MLRRRPKTLRLEKIVAAIESGARPSAIAAELGVSRSRGSQIGSLRSLGPEQMDALRRGLLSPANGLLLAAMVPAQRNELFRQMLNAKFAWSRSTLINKIKAMKAGLPIDELADLQDPNIRSLENRLQTVLCAPVTIKHSASGAGEVCIRYHDSEELQGFLDRVLGDLGRDDWS